MALPESRNKKASSTIKTSHKLIFGLLSLICIVQIRQFPKPNAFKRSSTKLTNISDSTNYHPPRPPFTTLVHVSHNCTLSNGKKVHISVALPHLILIGTQKGGTGTLKNMLKSNPDVVIARKGELHFLDDEVVMKAPGGWLNEANEGELCRLRKAYADKFNMKQMIPEREGRVRIAFEKTPSYLLRPTIPHAIDLICPHKPKILVTLRNPVDRAFSQYSMCMQKGNCLLPNLPNTTFEQAIETEVDHLIQRGLLAEGTLSLSEYEQRRNEFDVDNIRSMSPINLRDISLEEYAKVASNVFLINETTASGEITDSGRLFPHLLFRGMYALQLVPWVKKFGQDERMMILKFEDFAGDDANQTEVEEKILLFAGISKPVLKESDRQVKNGGFTKSKMNPITKEYLTWLYRPFNDLLPTLLGEEWRGLWDEVNDGSEQKGNNSTPALNSTVQHEIPDDDYAAGWNAMAKITKFKQWGRQHTKVLKSITLPLWLDAPKDASDDDRLGDIWLPPRLQIDDEIRALEYGVLFCAIGDIGFAKTQVVPLIRHLHENLGIPDAQGRAVHLKSRQGFALVTTRQFVEGPLKDWVSFFDAIYLTEDLPAYPFDWQSMTKSDAILKATKVHVMASSPFDTTIMMDLDSFPCQHDFALPLLAALGESDIALRNIVEEMEVVKDSRHFLGEHNSAVVVLNMKSIRTRMLLALYIQAYHRTSELGNRKTKRQRDQPSLLVAMQSMAEEFTPSDGRPAEIPNDSVRAVIDRHELGFIQHVDFDFSLVCSGGNACGQNSSCVISHKDQFLFTTEAKRYSANRWEKKTDAAAVVVDDKDAVISAKKEEGGEEEEEELIKYFGIGFKKTGTTTLDSMFSHLIDTIGGSRPSSKARTRAVKRLIGEGENNTKVSLSLALARKHHYFQDAPWCNEPTRLYRQLAALYPTAKFILTIRDPEEWYRSVVNWVECSPEKSGKCGEEKMEKYRKIFGAKSVSKADFIESFALHNEAARQYFVEELKQPHRLLEMDLTKDKDGTGWVKFCDFVGLSKEQCPTGDIPHENNTPTSHPFP